MTPPSYLSFCTPLSVLTILHVQPGRSFNVTRFTKESLNLPLYLPVSYAHLIFTPTRYPDESSLGPFDPKPPRSPVHLMREGQISDHDLRYRGLVSLGRNGTVNEVIIARLTSRHDGVYEIRDGDGNLVSSTLLQVIGEWQDTFQCYLSQSSLLPHSHSFGVSASYLCLYHPQREVDGVQFLSPSLFLLACLCHWLVSSCSWNDTRTVAFRRSSLALDRTARHQQTLQG